MLALIWQVWLTGRVVMYTNELRGRGAATHSYADRGNCAWHYRHNRHHLVGACMEYPGSARPARIDMAD